MISLAVLVAVVALASGVRSVPLDGEVERPQISLFPQQLNPELSFLPAIVNAGDVAAAESDKPSIASLPQIVNPSVDVAAAEEANEKPEISHRPSEVLTPEISLLPQIVNPEDVAVVEKEEIEGPSISNAPSKPSNPEVSFLPQIVNPEDVAVAEKEEIEDPSISNAPSKPSNPEISFLPQIVNPQDVAEESKPDFIEIPQQPAQESPCAQCFAYMSDLIDELTSNVVAVNIPNNREVPEGIEESNALPAFRPRPVPSEEAEESNVLPGFRPSPSQSLIRPAQIQQDAINQDVVKYPLIIR